MYKLDRLLQSDPSRNFSWTHYPLHLMDGHGDDGVEEEEDEVVLLPAAAMDATALAHATSSRFIRFSSPQTTGSTGRPVSAARNATAAAAPAKTSSSPPAARNGRAISAPRAMSNGPRTRAPLLPTGRSLVRLARGLMQNSALGAPSRRVFIRGRARAASAGGSRNIWRARA